MHRKILLGLIVATIAWFASAGTGAAQYSPDLDLTIEGCVTVPVGEATTLGLGGSGYQPGTEVVISLSDEDSVILVLATVTADAEGSWATEVTIPGNLPAGDYFLTADGDLLSDTYPIDDPKTPLQLACVLGVELLAVTGIGGGAIVAVALGMITAGGLLLFAGRDRRAGYLW